MLVVFERLKWGKNKIQNNNKYNGEMNANANGRWLHENVYVKFAWRVWKLLSIH